tara:strand:+ start:70 stop:1581 length:1512 start_codon:yes stop_codon:yes gene_type:complete
MKEKLINKIVKSFDSLINKTLIKLKKKTNFFLYNNSKVSVFNKLIITSISLLFLYLFYLSLPTLYDKTWVQNNIESKLIKEFKINFSISSDISYRILPAPHFLIKDSKIFKNDFEKAIPLADIKNLKVFISQSNFFNKEKMIINKTQIDNANFSLSRADLKLLNNSANNKFSDKKIKINNSKLFFKDKKNETITIVKISKAFLFFNSQKLINIFNLNGEAFNIPFTFDLNKKIYSSKNKTLNINSKKLNLNIFNESKKINKDLTSGENIISIFNSKIYSKYDAKENLIIFESKNSKTKIFEADYEGQLSINPFDLKFEMTIDDYELSKLFNSNTILTEFIKTKLLFNKNISIDSHINFTSNKKNTIFNSAKVNFNVINGKINFDQTTLINKKIGLLKLNNSNLFFKDDKLTLGTDILIDIKSSDNLFSFLQTSKQYRKPIKKIFIKLDYDFLSNQIEFKNLEIDDEKSSDAMLAIIEEFNDDVSNNLIRSRGIVNKLFSSYEG